MRELILLRPVNREELGFRFEIEKRRYQLTEMPGSSLVCVIPQKSRISMKYNLFCNRTIYCFCVAVIVLWMMQNLVTVYAYTGNGALIVHVTRTGECYHKEGCGYLRSDIEMTLEDAYIAGYRPCEKCNPPVYTGNAQRITTQERDNNKNYQEYRNSNRRSINYSHRNATQSSYIPLAGIGGAIAIGVVIKKIAEVRERKREQTL